MRKVRKIMRVPISLETPISEEGDSHISDLIEDRTQISPAEAVMSANAQEGTAQVLRTLSPREEKIIRMRFGIEDGSEHTLEEVGQAFSVTRERIRQIEAKTLCSCAIPRAPKSSNRSSMTCANEENGQSPNHRPENRLGTMDELAPSQSPDVGRNWHLHGPRRQHFLAPRRHYCRS